MAILGVLAVETVELSFGCRREVCVITLSISISHFFWCQGLFSLSNDFDCYL